MNEEDFEGTLVLEKLAEGGKVEAFFEAVDADDFERVRRLLHRAGLDTETIHMVLKKMADSEH